MNPATLEFLKQRFSAYYRKGTLLIPPGLEQREWGFLFFNISGDVRMRRHMGFATRREVTDYLRSMVPAHAFYSTAYYALPSAGTMNEKIWSGADLVFDLDADHIVRGSYSMMLERVKEEAKKLIAMLTEELGFGKKEIEIVFSGGRGYHIHIRNIAVREWGSQERRELVDYVCGIGIDPEIILKTCGLPISGWQKRYRKALLDELVHIQSLGHDDAIIQLTAIEGVAKKSASKFMSSIDTIIEALKNSDADFSVNDRVFRAILKMEGGGLNERLKDQSALTDEPVTTDIKRLIRMPTSLHGGSGFRVTPLTFSDFLDFDPLIDAVVFGENDVKVNISQSIPYPVPILGNEYILEKGVNSVPEALAVFLCCRGIAEFAGGVR
jgi:DNA primase small subunit